MKPIHIVNIVFIFSSFLWTFSISRPPEAYQLRVRVRSRFPCKTAGSCLYFWRQPATVVGCVDAAWTVVHAASAEPAWSCGMCSFLGFPMDPPTMCQAWARAFRVMLSSYRESTTDKGQVGGSTEYSQTIQEIGWATSR